MLSTLVAAIRQRLGVVREDPAFDTRFQSHKDAVCILSNAARPRDEVF
jgi:hypothetical protein